MDLIISTVCSVIGLVIGAVIAWHFTKKTYYAQVENQIELNEKITVITDRNKMLEIIHAMYSSADKGDTIWGQSVSGNIIGDVTKKVVQAAKRGVNFEIIFSEDSRKETSHKKELYELFELLKSNAKICIKGDNNIRVQGISTKEVLIAIPTSTKYISVDIKDEAIVKVFRDWFVSRFNDTESEITTKQ